MKRLMLLVLALTGIIVVATVWLLSSSSGLRTLINAADRFAPVSVDQRDLRGRLAAFAAADLTIEAAGTRIHLTRPRLRWSPGDLLGRKLHIAELHIDDMVVTPTAPPETVSRDPWPVVDLPLSFVVDGAHIGRLRLENDQGVAQLEVSDVALADLSLIDGQFEVASAAVAQRDNRLQLSGHLDTQSDYQHALSLTATQGMTWRLEGQSAGNLRGTDMAINVSGLADMEAQLRLLELATSPQASGTIALHSADTSQLLASAPPEPLIVTVGLEGGLSDFALDAQGQFAAYPSWSLRLQGGLAAAGLSLSSFSLVAPPSGEMQGSADWDRATNAVTADLNWADLQLGWLLPPVPSSDGDKAATLVLSQGQATLGGELDAWEAQLKTGVTTDYGDGQLDAAVTGDRRQAEIDTLAIKTAAFGRLDALGQVQYLDGVRLDLRLVAQQFNPQLLQPAVDASLDFDAHLQADLTDAVSAEVSVDRLRGSYRRQPLDGTAQVRLAGSTWLIDALDLTLGGSWVTAAGKLAGDGDAELSTAFSGVRLADVYPGWHGDLNGKIELAGRWPAVDLTADLKATEIAIGEVSLQQATLTSALHWRDDGEGQATLSFSGLQAFGQSGLAGTLDFDGALAAHQMTAELVSDAGLAQWAGRGGLLEQRYRGEIDTLVFEPSAGAPIRLSQPASFVVSTDQFELANACLVGSDARACIEVQHDLGARSGGGQIELQDLSLAWFSEPLGLVLKRRLELDGALTGAGQWQLQGTALTLDGQLTSNAGGIVLLDPQRDSVLRYRDWQIDVSGSAAQLEVATTASINEDGQLNGRVTVVDLLGEQKLVGQAQLLLPSLQGLADASAFMTRSEGALDARLTLAGSLPQPLVSADIALRDFATVLPTAGIDLHDGNLRLRSTATNRFDIVGGVRSGAGSLDLRGAIDLGAAGTAVELALRGQDFQAVRTPRLSVIASPDVSLVWRNDAVSIRGVVKIPSADIDLSGFDAVQRPSPDVVVVGREARADPLPVDADLTIELGDDVNIEGYGMAGRLSGQLRVVERPGVSTRGTGEIIVDGTYQAYGQNLSIERGRLLFRASPLDNPGINLVAERPIERGDVTAGVRITGTVQRPEATVFARPATDESNALSYLVLGRPLNDAGGGGREELTSAALTAGLKSSNALTAGLGEHLGFDEFGVVSSEALGGTGVALGRYLSPRLYVGYGLGLVENRRIFSLTYQLSRRWSLKGETGEETRGSLNYRIEK